MLERSKRDKESKIIMGIDPGTNFTGYGVLKVGSGEPQCLVLGYIDLSRYKDPYEKLGKIFERVSALLEEHQPDEVALEAPFYGKNVQSMLKLGRAQGVAMAAALTRGVQVYEYAPRRIKQAITGNGSASKEQVASLLKTMFKIDYPDNNLDATDGLAVALCHHFESSSILNIVNKSGANDVKSVEEQIRKASKGSRNQSWASFVTQNPDRQATRRKARRRKVRKQDK